MSSASAVVCREIFDENSQPSAEEISEYAAQLGIDPDSESHLLPLARDGLMQALPAPWKAYFDDKIQSHYYYNEETKQTQWEHPLDNIYKELVKKARDASVVDDTCASVQDIPTSEDYTKNLERVETKVESDEELSTDSENHGSDIRDNQTLTGMKRLLTPLGRPPPSPLSRLDKKLSDTRISPLRRSIDSSVSTKPTLMRNSSDRDLLSRPNFERPKLLFKQHSEIIDLKMHVLNSPEEENFSPLLLGTKNDKGLPLTGKGNMFLKVSKSDLPSPETDKSLPLDSVTKSDPPKGILREKLSDTLHKKVDSIFSGKKQPASFEEDRKSVRFKLENLPEPNLSPGSNSSSEQNDGQSSIISAAPPSVPSPIIPSSPVIPSSANISAPMVPLNQIVLTPLSTRPPLPPRPNDNSPREVKNLSGSDRDSVDSSSFSKHPPSRNNPLYLDVLDNAPSPDDLPSPGTPPSPYNPPSPDNLPSPGTPPSPYNPPSPDNLPSPYDPPSPCDPLSPDKRQSPYHLPSPYNPHSPDNPLTPNDPPSPDDPLCPSEHLSPYQRKVPAPLPRILSPLKQNPPSPDNLPSPYDPPSPCDPLSPDKLQSPYDLQSPYNPHSPDNPLSPNDPPCPSDHLSPYQRKLPAPLPRILSPLKQKPDPLPTFGNKKSSSSSNNQKDSNSSTNSDNVFNDSESHPRGTSPRRRVLRPPPGDYIKPDLFQKNFQKISDLVRPGDIETTMASLEEPVLSEKEARPRSPMIPQKSKISINLMESIESETSIDSPDREFANLDLNDLDESSNNEKPVEIVEKSSPKDDEISEKKTILDRPQIENLSIPQIKVPTLDFTKSIQSDSEESKKTSILEESKSKSHELSLKSHELSLKSHELSLKSPQIKISPTPSLGSERHSPRVDYSKPWSPLSTFKPLNKAISPQIKTSDSASSLGKGLVSPRLDGVILSQGKSSSDNVVVVYQFESQEENYPKPIKSPLIPDMGTRDLIERNKADEKRRLELALQKELESIRVEWSAREKKLKAELQMELKEAEDKFQIEKTVRLNEQAERHRKEMDDALNAAEVTHKQALEKATLELADQYQRDIEALEKQHIDNMERLQQQYKQQLTDQQQKLEIENDRALSEVRDQLQMNLAKERTNMIEENRNTIETLREEHTSRVTDLRHDYRAEVERLRTQHACHLEEVRSRLASERAASGRLHDERALQDKYKCLKEKYVRLKHDVKMSIERRNKRREMSMTTGSETEKSNSHKANQSLERCKEVNEVLVSAVVEPVPLRLNNNPAGKYNDNETSYSESNAHKPYDNNNEEWKLRRDNTLHSADTSQASAVKPQRPHRRTTVAFREPLRRRRDKDTGAATDCQDSSDATTADEKPKESVNGHGRRRCFTRLKSASTSRLNYSPKRGEGWSSPLESLRQQLRKLDDLEDQFPDLACQPAYSLRYPFTELGAVGVPAADTAELEFVRHRALVEREGMRRARAALKRRSDALRDTRHASEPHRAPSEEREVTELEVALHRARALLGEKEIRLRHIERALRRLADTHPPPLIQEATTSEASSGSEGARGVGGEGASEAGGAVLRSLRALHADVRDIWRALDARRPQTASPETSSCNAATTSQTRMTLSAPDPIIQDNSDGGVAERARGLRAWLQTAP